MKFASKLGFFLNQIFTAATVAGFQILESSALLSGHIFAILRGSSELHQNYKNSGLKNPAQ
jgi:hypothetical protein